MVRILLYIFTALKCEASALKELPCEVIVTGVGEKATECIMKLGLTADDYVLNVGICAGEKRGSGYLINQVISMTSGRRFYPDILFDSGAEEMTVTTSPSVVTELENDMLYDMESSIICENVLKVIPPSNFAIYKVVSDNGGNFPSKNEITQMIREHIDEIRKIAEMLISQAGAANYEFLPESIFNELSLTQYMRNELKDIEHYCSVSGKEDELLNLLKQMREEGLLPAKDKKTGREVLDEIYSHLR